jgi:hypothetical protein
MARAATSRLKVNTPLGSPPTLEWRAVGELLIDDSYQRTVEAAASQALIRRIAMFWDWGLCQPLAVSRRPDGKLLIVDGQHRASAAKLRGDIPHLPCVITSFASAGDEAAAFVALNQMRRPLSALDLFKAAIAAEDKEALLIAECLASAGLSMAPHANYHSWKPGMVQNVGGIRECLRVRGERVLRGALIVFGAAYKDEILRYAGTLFPGIAHVVADALRLRCSSQEIVDEFVPIIAARTQEEWAKQIIKLSPDHSRGRRGASWQVFEEAWRARHLAPATLPVTGQAAVILDAGEISWCQQCDRRVSGERATKCTSPFCSMKMKAA